jgi:hypothetical protein
LYNHGKAIEIVKYRISLWYTQMPFQYLIKVIYVKNYKVHNSFKGKVVSFPIFSNNIELQDRGLTYYLNNDKSHQVKYDYSFSLKKYHHSKVCLEFKGHL